MSVHDGPEYAHAGMLHAASEHDLVRAIVNDEVHSVADIRVRDLVNWAAATRTPDSAILHQPPFTQDAVPEVIGTAFTYHVVNRMVSIFLSNTPMPVPAGAKGLRGMAARVFGATVGKRIAARNPVAGESLRFIPEAELPDDFAWARSNPFIAAALAGFTQTVNAEAEKILAVQVQELLEQELGRWSGEDKGLGRHWLDEPLSGIKDQYKPVARLVLLSAFAPYQVSDADIQDFRLSRASDRELLVVTTWASVAAARRVASWWVIPTSDRHQPPDREASDNLPNETESIRSSAPTGIGGQS